MSKMQDGLMQLLNDKELRHRLSSDGIKSLKKYDIVTIAANLKWGAAGGYLAFRTAKIDCFIDLFWCAWGCR